MANHPVTLAWRPGESHGQRRLAGYSPWVCKESNTTERLHFYKVHKDGPWSVMFTDLSQVL